MTFSTMNGYKVALMSDSFRGQLFFHGHLLLLTSWTYIHSYIHCCFTYWKKHLWYSERLCDRDNRTPCVYHILEYVSEALPSSKLFCMAYYYKPHLSSELMWVDVYFVISACEFNWTAFHSWKWLKTHTSLQGVGKHLFSDCLKTQVIMIC